MIHVCNQHPLRIRKRIRIRQWCCMGYSTLLSCLLPLCTAWLQLLPSGWLYTWGVVVTLTILLPRARMRKAGLSNWFCLPSVSHQNFGLITTTKGLNTSIHHSNDDNRVHGVPEATNRTGDRSIVAKAGYTDLSLVPRPHFLSPDKMRGERASVWGRDYMELAS